MSTKRKAAKPICGHPQNGQTQPCKTPTETLIAALRILAVEIQSGDGVANAAITEAADRLEEMELGLRVIATWASCDGGSREGRMEAMEHIQRRAMDSLGEKIKTL